MTYMLNFYLRRGSKSSYSHLEYFAGGGPPNPNERRPLLVFCPSPTPTTRTYGARERLCIPFMHAFGVRVIFFFLGYAPDMRYPITQYTCINSFLTK